MSTHFINDPIHGVMEFDSNQKEIIKSIIDKPVYQRMRQISQLGMASHVFPGAVHTRFNHCIGAAYLAKKIAEQIDALPKECELAMTAALIHDIGHGPFSHAFEELFHRKYEMEIRHELWTPPLAAKLGNSSSISEAVDLIIKKNAIGIAPKLVSGQLDVDRLDYLLRDSHFCGVSYGIYDLDWLIRCLAREGNKLVLEHKGLGVLEQFFAARRLMTHNLYYHGKIKAAEDMLISFLVETVTSLEEKNKITQEMLSPDLRGFLEVCIKNKDNLSDLPKIDEAVDFYARLTETDIHYSIKRICNSGLSESSDIMAIATNLQNRRMPKVLEFQSSFLPTITDRYETLLASGQFKRWQVYIIDKPFKTYKTDSEEVFIRSKDGIIRHAHETSQLLHRFSNANEPRHYIAIDASVAEKEAVQSFIKDLIVPIAS